MSRRNVIKKPADYNERDVQTRLTELRDNYQKNFDEVDAEELAYLWTLLIQNSGCTIDPRLQKFNALCATMADKYQTKMNFLKNIKRPRYYSTYNKD